MSALSLLVLSLAYGTEPPGPPSHTLQSAGPARLLVAAPPGKDGISISLADVFTITLQVDGGPALEVKTPDKITTSPGWRLIDASPAGVTDFANKRRRWQQSYTFEPLIPGTLTLQIEPLQVKDSAAPSRKIAWKPISVHAMASITALELKNLRDPTVVETVPEAPVPEPTPWALIAGGVGVAGLGVLSFVWWHRRRAAPTSPEQRALHELQRVLALHLPEQGKSDRFHRLLANIVRRYLERKYQLPAPRRTTGEFLGSLASSDKLSAERRDFLRDFLPLSDLAKFAGLAAGAKECLGLADKVRSFIEIDGRDSTAHQAST